MAPSWRVASPAACDPLPLRVPAAGYQAGQDFVFDVTGGAHLASLAAADFI